MRTLTAARALCAVLGVTSLVACDDTPGEETPPEITVLVTQPSPGSLASEIVMIAADAGPQDAIAGVEFAILEAGLEVRFDTDLTPPYEAALDTTEWPDGPLSLRVTAAGREGQVAMADLNIVVDNEPPRLEIVSPAADELLFLEDESVEVVLRASDGSGIERVEAFVNDVALPETTSTAANEYRTTLDLTRFADSLDGGLLDVALTATAADAFGRRTDASVALRLARRLRWRAVVPHPVAGAGVTSPDGRVYYLATENGQLWALDMDDGTELCRSGEAGAGFRGPAIAPDGTALYLGTGNGLFALRPAPECGAAPLWQLRGGEVAQGVPAVEPDTGTIFFTTREGGLHGATPGGALRWTRPDVGLTKAGPALVRHLRTLVVGSDRLYAIRLDADDMATSGFVWTAETGGDLDGAPTWYEDRIYVGSADFNVYAFHVATGERIWPAPFATARQISTSPAVDDEGYVYVTSRDGSLYRLSADRVLDWEYSVPSGIDYSSPVIDESSNLVFFGETGATGGDGLMHGVLHAVDLDSGEARWTATLDGSVSSTPTLADGTVVIGTALGQVYAFFIDGDAALAALAP